MATTKFDLPYLQSGQAQKHVTHNEALTLIDALLPGVVASASTTTAPGSPAEGETYIVPTGGVFGSVTVGEMAVYSGGEWVEILASFGHRVAVLDEGRTRINAGSRGWMPGQTIGAFGGTIGPRCIDLEVDLSGGGTQATVTDAIPARVIVLGLTTWIDTNVTGPDQIKVGVSGELSKFGSYIWREAPSSNIGVVGPFATYADTDLLVTAQDDVTAFTAGTVRLREQDHRLAPGHSEIEARKILFCPDNTAGGKDGYGRQDTNRHL